MPRTSSKPKNPLGCVFCKSSEDDELHFGKFFRSEDLAAHNFCMLFSSGLSQNGKNDADGFAGFLPKDIKMEISRGRRLRCSYCKIGGATIGCCKPQCKKVFHFRCGLQNNSHYQFFGSFPTYCSAHKESPVYSEGELPKKDPCCAICYSPVPVKKLDAAVWTTCCKSGWFHKLCVQQQALSAGYFFRCPLCNNTDQFQKQMLHLGVYIPQQDASWELEENAFQELLYRYEQCDADDCLCPKGRKYTRKNPPWHLVRCEDCGSQGRHVGCDISVTSKYSWKCSACLKITKKLNSIEKRKCIRKKLKSKPESQKTNEKKRTSVNSGHNSSSENICLVKEEVSSAAEELQKAVDASCNAVHGGGGSIRGKANYSIVKISESESPKKAESGICQENEISWPSGGCLDKTEESSNSEHLLMSPENSCLPETIAAIDSIDSKDFAKISTSELENSIDLFAEVDAIVPEENCDLFFGKPEIYHQDSKNKIKEVASSNVLNHNLLNEWREPCAIGSDTSFNSGVVPVVNSMDLDTGMAELQSIKNYHRRHEREYRDNSSIAEAEKCKNSSSTSNNEMKYCYTNASVDNEIPVLQGIPLVDISQNAKDSVKEESNETCTVENDVAELSQSPCGVSRSSGKKRRHSKRFSSDVENKLSKKQKLNGMPVKSCNTVIIFSITRDVKQNINAECTYERNPSTKAQNEISAALGCNSLTQNGQNVGERYSREAADAENMSGNKTPIIMNVCGGLRNNGGKGRCEPLVKLSALHSKLTPNMMKSLHEHDNSEVSSNSGHAGKNHLESENRLLKKQKLNNMPTKKKHSTNLKYKDTYLCIKALFGKPCDCCNDKSRFTKKGSDGKSNHHKKFIQSCKQQYDIGFYKSGSSHNKFDEKHLGNKHCCSRAPNYVVDVLKSGSTVSAVVETKDKLSIKPQIIHLKNVSH